MGFWTPEGIPEELDSSPQGMPNLGTPLPNLAQDIDTELDYLREWKDR